MHFNMLIALTLASLIATPAWSDLKSGIGALDRSDYKTALTELKPLAERGNPEAQYNLGKMYMYGWGVSRNELEAAEWFRKAAQQKHPKAQKMLAYLCDKGVGAEFGAPGDKQPDAAKLAREGRTLCPKSVQKLEDMLVSSPGHLSARIRLLGYYFANGAKEPGIQKTIETRRTHILWLIQNQPDADILSLPEASLDPSGHKLADKTGYIEAKRLWLEQTAKPQVTAKTYLNAARYFQLHDKPLAEDLLLKGKQAYASDQSWSANLGYLYALGILGITGLNNTGIPSVASATEAKSAFATKARQVLETSSDPVLSGTAGAILSQYGMMLVAFGHTSADENALAEKLLTKAQSLDPQNPYWSQMLAQHLMIQVKRTPLASTNAALMKRALMQMEKSLALTNDTEWRAGRLGEISKLAYNAGEYQKAEKYAGELLALAEPHPADPHFGQAWHDGNMVLGQLALKQNDIAKARLYLIKAGHTPGGGTLSSFGPNMSLARDMLAHGEKKAVIEYLELCKAFWTYPNSPLNQWIQDVRAGKMPDFGPNLIY